MIQFVWLAHSPLVNIAYLLFRYRLDEVEARRTEYKCLADPRLKERYFRGAKGDNNAVVAGLARVQGPY